MTVGERITMLREQRGITVNKLANMAGISQAHLRDVEMGVKNPTVETLSYFCDALGISLAEFFSENEREINPFLYSSIKLLSDEQQMMLADFLNSICKSNKINADK
ncbi:MAG: helix-turn-helix domain-containing protein [Clostridia bacterium]